MDSDEETTVLEGSFVKVATSQQYQCDTCGKRFNKKYNLSRHLKTHSTNDVYRCTQCNRYFQKEDEMRTHMDNAHPRLICDICRVAITRKGDMDTHIAIMHKDVNNNAKVKVFSCHLNHVIVRLSNKHFIKTT